MSAPWGFQGARLNPDRKLLDVCVELTQRQAKWQALWEAAGRPRNASLYDGDQDAPVSPEVHALRHYTRKVWPATDDPYTHIGEKRTDLAHGLVFLPAATPEGLVAKAAAVLALHEVAMLSEIRDDQADLELSVMNDLVGPARRPVGEDAA